MPSAAPAASLWKPVQLPLVYIPRFASHRPLITTLRGYEYLGHVRST